MRLQLFTLLFSLFTFQAFGQVVVTHFENYSLPNDSFEDARSGRRTLLMHEVAFNFGLSPWNTWNGWAISNVTNNKDGRFSNQYSVSAGSGVNHSQNYLVAYDRPRINFTKSQKVAGFFICNTTYTDSVIRHGNLFTKDQTGFGGKSGLDPDFFVVTAHGYYNGLLTDSSQFYLADFRFTDNSKDYVVESWKWWDLTSLNLVDSVVFSFNSSDRYSFGINTPAYFCLDNLNGPAPDAIVEQLFLQDAVTLPDDSFDNGTSNTGGFLLGNTLFHNQYDSVSNSWSGFALSNMNDTITPGWSNQYSPINTDLGRNSIIANGYGELWIDLPYSTEGHLINAIQINNTTYAYRSMTSGDAFAKKFGGADGMDPDYFKVSFVGYNSEGEVTDTVHSYLADFRYSDSKKDYILKNWDIVDLTKLGKITKIECLLSSSDTGIFGMNTPAYFAIAFFNGGIFINTDEINQNNTSIYPNPVLTQFCIMASGNCIYRIYDLTGKLIGAEHFNERTTVSTANFLSGLYLIEIENESGLITKDKLIIQP